ncbi:hypothetical protein Zmor_010428 [Zophobas morio]|uniref:Uncharacterized protein n=1 Tax=Zophobas morio TaxID=2755281 RepID=A0AA38MJV1_9CUCU|nr:hypothetical protein Zmor_010428 [Zophobas morio]
MNCEIVGEIPLEFGIRIIQQHFMTPNKPRNLDSMPAFIFDFLSIRDQKQRIFDQIFSNIDQCTSKEDIFAFLRDLYHRVMDSTCADLRYMEPYLDCYAKKISLKENFYDFIKIFFLKCKLKSSEWAIDALTNEVLGLFEEVLLKCGPHVIPFFAREINSNLPFFARNVATNNEFYYSMMKQRPTPIVAVLLLEVVSAPPHGNLTPRKAFHEFVALVRGIEDVGVQIYLQYKKYKSWSAHIV